MFREVICNKIPNEDSAYDDREQLYKASRCFLLHDLQFCVLKCQEI